MAVRPRWLLYKLQADRKRGRFLYLRQHVQVFWRNDCQTYHCIDLADVVEFIYTLYPELLESLQFVIIERFDALQQQQKNYFKESFGDVVSLTHYKSLSELTCKNAFFIANEIFDAFGCELLYNGKIASVKDDKVEFDIVDEEILLKAKKYHKEKGEIAVGYEAFAKEMVASAERFEFISFD